MGKNRPEAVLQASYRKRLLSDREADIAYEEIIVRRRRVGAERREEHRPAKVPNGCRSMVLISDASRGPNTRSQTGPD